jgi:hypothetical protein
MEYKTLTIKKNRKLIAWSFGIGLLPSLWFFYKLNINIFEVLLSAFNVLFNGTIQYSEARLGSLVLNSSLVGLGLVATVHTILLSICKKENNLNVNNSTWKWIIPTVGFVYSITFSIIKLLIGYVEEEKIANGIGHISFFYLIIGTAVLIYWFISWG